MNTYKCSDGTRISKSEIDKRVRKSKEEKLQEQLNEYGYNFCIACHMESIENLCNDMELRILDCAHIESVDSCQKNGHAEKAWDKDNISILCRYHHKLHDKTFLF